MTLPSGIRLGRYKILAPLGTGGMGEVYRARDEELGRDVAVKLLPEDNIENRKAIERFTREAQAASALNHPNIVTIYEIGQSERGRFIAMEMIEGDTLRALAGRGLSLESTVKLVAQVAKALAAAHAAGIVHRDIKPENIMARKDGYVKVLDFGLARLLTGLMASSTAETSTDTPGTSSSMLVGTVRYMSPEQVRRQAVGTASDIFSLGIVLYELTTGQHPFSADSQIALMQGILSFFPASPSRLNPEIPPTLNTLILQMLEKDPQVRPNAAEVDGLLSGIEAKLPGVPLGPAAVPTSRRPVGREKQLAELRTAYQSAAAGHGLMLCLPGEPGIGKTTLVEDFLLELANRKQPCVVGRGGCSERLAGTEAYLPFLEALESIVHSETGDSAARIMRVVAPNWYGQIIPSSLEPSSFVQQIGGLKAASQERLKREMSAFLQEISRIRPLILFFDDVHWSDVSTVDMLSYISGKIQSMHILIAASYRPSDLILGGHPFLGIKLDLQARGICREIPLDFLSRADIEQYLVLEFPGHRFPKEFSALIHAKTEGSPLFMVDLLRYLRDRGVVEQTRDGWELVRSVPDLERELPPSVRSMIERKTDRLPDTERQLVLAASVQGNEFDSATVSKALSWSAVTVEQKLKILDRDYGLVRLIGERELPDRTLTVQYRFVHVLYQNVLYASLTPTHRAVLSAAAAEALVGHYGDKSATVASDLAFLFETARDFARASHFFLLAAQNATRVFAHQEAIILARRGLELVEALPDTPERAQQELNLLTTLGGPLMATKGYASSEVGKAYSRARELSQQITDAHQKFTVLAGVFPFYAIGAEFETARHIAEQLMCLAENENESGLRLLAHHAMGCCFTYEGNLRSAREHFEKGINFYQTERHGSYAYLFAVDIGVNCRIHLARTLWLLGYPAQALDNIQEGVFLARKLAHPFSLAFALLFAAKVHQFRREVEKTLEQTQAALLLSEEHGFEQVAAWAAVWRGWSLAELGRPEVGIAEMRQSLAAQRSMGSEIVRPHFLSLLAEALDKAGHREEGLQVVAEAMAQVERTDERYYEAELYRLKGELMLSEAAGWPEAEACFSEAIDLARGEEAKSLELRAAMSLCRLHQRQKRKLQEGSQMLAEVYGWFTEGFETADLREARTLLEQLG